MSDMLYKVHQCKVLDADLGKPIVAQVSTADVDSDGDVIWQEPTEKGRGWLLDGFNKRGGRVYWMHNPFVPNLAKARAWTDAGQLMLSVDFDREDELAASLDRKIRSGYLDEWSVGFRPVKYEQREKGGLDIYESELWEVSVVNQGANANTAVLAKVAKQFGESMDLIEMYESRIRNLESEVMRLANKEDPAKARELDAFHQSLRQYIRTGV